MVALAELCVLLDGEVISQHPISEDGFVLPGQRKFSIKRSVSEMGFVEYHFSPKNYAGPKVTRSIWPKNSPWEIGTTRAQVFPGETYEIARYGRLSWAITNPPGNKV